MHNCYLFKGDTLGGGSASYDWTLPNNPHGKCVLRVRYNISTADYDGWQTFKNDDVKINLKYNISSIHLIIEYKPYTYFKNTFVAYFKGWV